MDLVQEATKGAGEGQPQVSYRASVVRCWYPFV